MTWRPALAGGSLAQYLFLVGNTGLFSPTIVTNTARLQEITGNGFLIIRKVRYR